MVMPSPFWKLELDARWMAVVPLQLAEVETCVVARARKAVMSAQGFGLLIFRLLPSGVLIPPAPPSAPPVLYCKEFSGNPGVLPPPPVPLWATMGMGP